MTNRSVYTRPISKWLIVSLLFVFISIVLSIEIIYPISYASILLLVISVPFLISVLTLLAKGQTLYFASLPLSFAMPFFSPIFSCLCAISIMSASKYSNSIIGSMPTVIFIYCIAMTLLEYLLIKWYEIPKARMKAIFESKKGKIMLAQGGQVLDFSPFRDNNNWLFSGKLGTTHKTLLAIVFLYSLIMLPPIYDSIGDNSMEFERGIALLLSSMGFMTQPYLLDFIIKIRLTLMKQRGEF